MANNIFDAPFNCGVGLIPFDRITEQDYEPAIERALAAHNAEIDAIVNNPEPPTMENTVVALERSGAMLERVLSIFYPMLSAMCTPTMMDISQRVVPRLSEHSSAITLNTALWKRIEWVRDHCDPHTLDTEDAMLLHNTVLGFERSGATLEEPARSHFRELTMKLSQLTLQFEQNVLQATSAFEMYLTEAEVDGLPDIAREAASDAAKRNNHPGEFLITLHAPSYLAFMKYATRRDLRERLYRAQNSKAIQGDFDNRPLVAEIANLRLEMAQLLGHESFAHYRLERTMAGTTQGVYGLLDQLRDAYTPAMRREMEQLQHFAAEYEGHDITLMPWDYTYYGNKLKDSLFSYTDEELRPYFELSRVAEGVFGLATRLYGLQFEPIEDAPVFDDNVRVYRVLDADGSLQGTLYTDFFPRDTKQSGAWMTNFAEQRIDASGHDERPIVTLTMNFTRPTATKPSLLTLGEVRTFVHEFGHALHSLLSRCRYMSLSGTNVYRDFVELPSQFHENFVTERAFLDSFARHYVTGERIPQSLIDKVIAASQFGAGYACLRQLGFGYLDMAWHTLTSPFDGDVAEFEHAAQQSVSIFAPVDGCLTSPHFTHIFAGGYASGYYGYKWAEVLDADAFERFKEEGIFNRVTAQSFRDCILARGGTAEPAALYRAFRGREPHITALLHRDGIPTPQQD